MKKEHIIMICAGIAAGIFFTFSPFGLLVFSVFLLCIYLIYRYSPEESRAFLIKLFIAGFLIRIPLVMLNYFLGLHGVYGGSDTQPDAIIYNSNAFYIAKVMSGLDFSKDIFKELFLAEAVEQRYLMYNGALPLPGAYQFGFYANFIGILYSWLGYAPIAAKLINSLAGCIGAILTYAIAKVLVKVEKVAKIAAFLVMFFPSLLYWSVTLLKDPLANCFFLLYTLMAMLYLKNGKKIYVLSMLISCILMSLLKTRMPILLWTSFVMFLAIRFFAMVMRKKILARSVILLIFFIVVAFSVILGHARIVHFLEDSLNGIFSTHKSAATDYPTASAFKLYYEDFYNRKHLYIYDIVNTGMIFILCKAMVYYFLLPFPWDILNLRPSLFIFYLQGIFIIACLPFMLIGILNCVKRAPVIALSLITLIVLIALPQAMAEGIMGNVVRHRDMFMPLILIFSSHGLYIAASRLEQKRGNPE